MAGATPGPEGGLEKIRRAERGGRPPAFPPPAQTETRKSLLRSRRSMIEPMNRASASAPSGPAASEPGESLIGNTLNRARIAAPLLDILIAPSANDGRHFAHTIPPRDTTKYTAAPLSPLTPLGVAQMRQRV